MPVKVPAAPDVTTKASVRTGQAGPPLSPENSGVLPNNRVGQQLVRKQQYQATQEKPGPQNWCVHGPNSVGSV